MTTLETLLAILGALLLLIIGYYAGRRIGEALANRHWERKLPAVREDAAKRSRAVLQGQFTEQLAPFLPDFPFSPSEARFVGKPVDFIVFKGLEAKAVEEVIFVEVKTGQSRLGTTEKSLREAVEAGKVRWEEYRPGPKQP